MESPEVLMYSLDADLAEKHVAAACSDGTVRLYNVKDRQLEPVAVLEGHEGPVTKALFVNFGELIVSGDFAGKVVVWKAEDGKYVKRLEKVVAEGPVYDVAVRYSDEELVVFCGCGDGFLVTLKISTTFSVTEERKRVHRFGIPALDCNAECLVTAGQDFMVAVHADGEEQFLKHHDSPVTCVGVAPSNAFHITLFATGDESGRLCIVERKNKEFKTKTVELGAPCHSITWSRAGFVLSVVYGEEQLKSYMLGESGEFEEIAMKEETQ